MQSILKVLRLPAKLALAAALVFLVYFYGLSNTGMIGPDEPRYAAIGTAMAQTGDWVTPRLWGEPWFEKPPLLYWMTAMGYQAGLGPDLAPRVPVATISVVFLLFYFLQIRREFGERAAWYASAMLSTSAGWLAYSHVAVTDLPLAACYSASILLALPWVRSGGRRGLLAGGALLGVAVLAKGFVPLVLSAPLLWAGRRRRWLDLVGFAGASVMIAAPWYVLAWIRNGQPFIDEFIWKHHVSRFISPDLQHVQPFWFYVPVLPALLFPWTPMLLSLRNVLLKDLRVQLLAIAVAFGFVFFSVSTNKLPGYVLPLLPLLTALLAIALAARPLHPALIAASAALLVLTPTAAATLPAALAHGLGEAGVQYGPAAVTLLFLIAAAFATWAAATRRAACGFAIVASLSAASAIYVKVTAFPALDRVVSSRARWRERASTACVDEGMSRSVRYGMNYYAGRTLPFCSTERRRE